ncbi:MAG: uroporphyrinogen-III synthase [Gammaproteobacteria bacterium]|nr:uroporphyrinogen-III synthase [Gammaproteobacteria bacterium]
MPTPKSDLAGLRVLVTRPAEQAAPLCRLLEEAGGVATHYPTIAIEALPIKGDINPAEADIAIFISRNAVRFALKNYPQFANSAVETITVGKGSAEEYFKITGRQISYTPHQHFNSEGLLALPQLAEVDGKEIILFKGEGGRDKIESELKYRGARVIPLELYRRTIPADPPQIDWPQIDIIVTTSNMALENLWEMTPVSERQLLLSKPLIVISDRGEKLAEELGFHYHPLQAPSADSSELLKTLLQWQQDSETTH